MFICNGYGSEPQSVPATWPRAKLLHMSGPANLVVTDAPDARQALADLVMAWARDSSTGEPRYILELDADHRGSKCGCECPSCGKPLVAVNAAKAEFVRRPHFRHPDGAHRDECLVLAARAAALRQLHEEGWLDLPRRRMSARVAGLSGEFHEAWVELPPVRIQISQIDYRDRATAVVTLDDGRQLRVDLTGTPGMLGHESPDGVLAPTIYLAISDPELAALTPDELRRRARLQPIEMCWASHWDDPELQRRAEVAARDRARFYFDDVPNGLVLPEGLDPILRRETVLHYEVKRILEETERLTIPEVTIDVEVPGIDGQTIHGRWVEEEEQLRLASVRSEMRNGRLVPDITCESFGADGHARHLPLLIEVTVTNQIDEERLDRIQATGEATLEIDLSLAGGRVNRDELKRLVVDEVATKRWLFNPDLEWQRSALLARLVKQVEDERAALDAHAKWVSDRRAQVLSTPLSDIASEYLDAVTCMFDAARGDREAARSARELVADAADKLAIRGYPEAGDENLVGTDNILSRVMSIKLGRPVGYRCDNLMAVLNAIRQTTGPQLSALSIYFIAARAYPPQFNTEQQEWFDGWASEVRNSILAGETTYMRDPAFDRLLSLLFPEMAAGLAKPFGKLTPGMGVRWDKEREVFVRPAIPERGRAMFLESQPRSDRAGERLLDTKPGDWFLRGRDLEAWKRANPEAARVWFSRPSTDE